MFFCLPHPDEMRQQIEDIPRRDRVMIDHLQNEIKANSQNSRHPNYNSHVCIVDMHSDDDAVSKFAHDLWDVYSDYQQRWRNIYYNVIRPAVKTSRDDKYYNDRMHDKIMREAAEYRAYYAVHRNASMMSDIAALIDKTTMQDGTSCQAMMMQALYDLGELHKKIAVSVEKYSVAKNDTVLSVNEKINW
jgi:hypothetical protein